MASLASYPNGLKLVMGIIIMLIFFFTMFPSISVGTLSEGEKQMKLVLGSKPPRCMNKCLSCRPCMAALVTHPHHKKTLSSKRDDDDESYYLLSWKCKCGGKYFQP